MVLAWVLDVTACVGHRWIGRGDVSTVDVQRYRCDKCGVWGWRRFLPELTPIRAYSDGRSYDEITVRSTATLPGAFDDEEDT